MFCLFYPGCLNLKNTIRIPCPWGFSAMFISAIQSRLPEGFHLITSVLFTPWGVTKITGEPLNPPWHGIITALMWYISCWNRSTRHHLKSISQGLMLKRMVPWFNMAGRGEGLISLVGVFPPCKAASGLHWRWAVFQEVTMFQEVQVGISWYSRFTLHGRSLFRPHDQCRYSNETLIANKPSPVH